MGGRGRDVICLPTACYVALLGSNFGSCMVDAIY